MPTTFYNYTDLLEEFKLPLPSGNALSFNILVKDHEFGADTSFDRSTDTVIIGQVLIDGMWDDAFINRQKFVWEQKANAGSQRTWDTGSWPKVKFGKVGEIIRNFNNIQHPGPFQNENLSKDCVIVRDMSIHYPEKKTPGKFWIRFGKDSEPCYLQRNRQDMVSQSVGKLKNKLLSVFPLQRDKNGKGKGEGKGEEEEEGEGQGQERGNGQEGEGEGEGKGEEEGEAAGGKREKRRKTIFRSGKSRNSGRRKSYRRKSRRRSRKTLK